ncbi:TetR/AcrR family transcriptional regulator [Roseibium sp. RKSG952]|uniref:TetR/AcrR family transcriptional regulator n=1 Tax=Roseibium sp. RKSG952 TaxID=2529384 RepID=UPI0012BD6504|nr:TetR/AcrR family transcriptional regulator [Roseibium sp. RKSG952]MTI01215.1 TetR/AcrR family transcriptional regulator [Roseibium sp. RKSG952]
MSKQETRKEKTRQAILNASKSVFLTEGYVLASMDTIAARAQVTKQTVYRYFPSKLELFEATLRHMGPGPKADFLESLEVPDTREALIGFATGFMRSHLRQEHLDTIRLLIAEAPKAPEIVRSFFAMGPSDTKERLHEFFRKRLGVDHPEIPMRLWTAMLFAHQEAAMLGRGIPTEEELAIYAETATDYLLAGLAART